MNKIIICQEKKKTKRCRNEAGERLGISTGHMRRDTDQGQPGCFFRTHHGCRLIPGPGSLFVRNNGMTTSYPAGKCQYWIEKKLTLGGSKLVYQIGLLSSPPRSPDWEVSR